jgi:hypothetical protein
MQTTWKVFSDLREAQRGTRGATGAALRVIAENMLIDERLSWLATADVYAFGVQVDGIVALSGQRAYVGMCDGTDALAYWVDRAGVNTIQQVRGNTPHLSTFSLSTMPEVTAIQLTPSSFEYFREAIESWQVTSERIPVQANAPLELTKAPVPDSATELLLQLKRLLDAGVLSEGEFEAKKAEVLARL